MATVNPYGPYPNASLIDKMIGTGYPIVRNVSENMEYIKHVSYYMPQLYIIADQIENLDPNAAGAAAASAAEAAQSALDAQASADSIGNQLDDMMVRTDYDPQDIGGDAFSRPNHTGTQTPDTIYGAIWDSESQRTMKDRSKRIAHSDDFAGMDKTGNNPSHAPLIRQFNQAQTARVVAEVECGNFTIEQTLGQYEGLRLRGGGNGFWRARPFNPWNFEETENPFTTRIIGVGTGPKTRTFPNITSQRNNGFHRANTQRQYNNVNDEFYEMFDGTLKDANQAAPATLRQFSAMLSLGSNDGFSKPCTIEDIMFIPNCPADTDGAVGVRGYGDLVNVYPWADWDFGVVLNGMSMSQFRNVNVVGYFRERGVLLMPTSSDSVSEGQGEHFHWNGGYIQSGLSIRSADIIPFVAKDNTNKTLDVLWWPSHQLAVGTYQTTNGVFTVTNVQYIAGSPALLRLTVAEATTAIKINDNAGGIIGSVIRFPGSTGISHTTFENMYIADHAHSSGLEKPNAAFGGQAGPYAGAIEASGYPCRAAKFVNVTPIISNRVGFHIGIIENIEMYMCYTEPKSAKSVVGSSSDLGSGCLFIAGPSTPFKQYLSPDYACSIESHGMNFASGVNRDPLVRPSTNSRLGPQDDGDAGTVDWIGEVDVFNPAYYFDDRMFIKSSSSASPGLPSTDLDMRGLNGKAISMNRRETNGNNRNVIKGDATAVVTIGSSADTSARIEPPLDVRYPVTTSAALGSATDPINTTNKRQGKPVWDSTTFKVMIATTSGATGTWRACDNSSNIVPV